MLGCFTRLTRALLGATSLADDKREHGMPLVVLGLRFEARRDGVRVRVDEEKAATWLADVEVALSQGKLSAGNAATLAGRLSFAVQNTFHR